MAFCTTVTRVNSRVLDCSSLEIFSKVQPLEVLRPLGKVSSNMAMFGLLEEQYADDQVGTL